jgi:ankyrin repeat protein
MMASEMDHLSIAKKLIGLGANVNAKNKRAASALMFALNKGNEQVAELLVQSGSDVNAKDDVGWTPLMYAAKSGMSNLVQKLIDNGADIHARSKAGASPVFIAVFHDHIAIATKLIDLGAQPVSVDSHVNDTFATAKLYKLTAEIREKGGNKHEAANHYQTAASFFEKASAGFKEKAGEMKKNFWKATFANALMAGIAAGGATYQAQQTGVGIQQYQQVGTGRFTQMEKTFLAKAEQCHSLAVECSSLSQKLRQ